MFVKEFVRVECGPCGSVFSVLTTLDDDRYDIEFCTNCGSDNIDTYEEVTVEEVPEE